MMKLNKKNYKESFSEIKISQEMKEELMKIPYNNDTKKTFRRATAFLVAAAIIVLSGVSVFAGVNLYNFYLKKDGKYAESLVLEKNLETVSKNKDNVMNLSKMKNVVQPEFVKIEFDYLPKVFKNQPHTGEIVKFDYKNKSGITFDIIDVSGKSKITLYKESVVDSEITTLNGNSVYYFEQQADPSFDDPFNKHIYMYINKFDYLVHGYVGSTVPKKVVYKVFQNLSLVECEEWESHNISDWIEPEDEESYTFEDGNYYLDNNHFVQVGDTEKVAYDNENDIEITVNNIEISDNLSMMDESFKKKYLDKSGKLKQMKVECYGDGDGINSLSELQATKYYDMVYIYETVTYKNTSDKDINDFFIYHQIVSPPDNIYVTYDVFENLEDKYRSVTYDLNYDYRIGEWAYDSFSKAGVNSPNCIDIPANDEVTVNIGFFVAEETLKEDLWIDIFQGNSINNGSSVEDAVLVDIPQ